MTAQRRWALARQTSGCIVCCSNGSWRSGRSRGTGKRIFRKPCGQDKIADAVSKLYRQERVGGELMAAFPAEGFLKSKLIFDVAIKRMTVVAFRTVNLVYFSHEDPSPFWNTCVLL